MTLLSNDMRHVTEADRAHVWHHLSQHKAYETVDPRVFVEGKGCWLTEQDGPITDVQMLLARASYFALDEAQALAVLGEVHAAVSNWRQVALGPEVGLRAAELDDFAPAFEHEQMDAAAALLGR